MINLSQSQSQIQCVSNFKDLISTPFQEEINAILWKRKVIGNFAELVEKLTVKGNISEVCFEELFELELSKEGQHAREFISKDYKLLKAHGASPILNLIKCYEKDTSYPLLPTDVYSFHVDRSPIPTDTFLCTYHGASSEILPNAQAKQKILIPEIRDGLKKLYNGPEEGFDDFLIEYFFDLHYQSDIGAKIVKLGVGALWRLSVDHPESNVLPCIHRAPEEKDGLYRLMLIC